MSGKVPKRVLTERTGGSREGSRIVNGVKMNEGAAMLGLVGSVGRRNTAWTQIKKSSFDCKPKLEHVCSYNYRAIKWYG